MKHRRPGLASAAALLLLLQVSGCGEQQPQKSRFYAFGTRVELSIWGAEPEQQRAAARMVRTELERLHRVLHPWSPEGGLARINRELASGMGAAAPPEVLELLELSQAARQASGGLFDPATGSWVALWGFHADQPAGVVPSPEALAELLDSAPRLDQLRLRDGLLRSTNPALILDFGGLAKGYTIDRLRHRLQALGVTQVLIDIGGDLGASGQPGGRPWRIGLRHPRKPAILGTVDLEGGESIVTSGDYERYFESGGQRYHHIMDPRSGRPAEGTMSVTVIHRDAAWADAAATALFVAGAETWRELATALGVETALLIDGAGRLHLTGTMAARLRLDFDPEQGLP